MPDKTTMLTIASLLAAMTIAGAFWVGVLAARRLRDWGEGRRSLEEGEQPLALVAASGALQDEERVRRIRERVAQRLMEERTPARRPQPRALGQGEHSDLGLSTLREGDILVIEDGQSLVDGDYVVEGLVHLREGSRDTVVVVMRDGGRERWLVGSQDADPWFVVDPLDGHGLRGEPPRVIEHGGKRFTLERRGQASAAVTGRARRPDFRRAATYVYRSSPREILWLERWRDEVVMGFGNSIPARAVQFLPGS